MQIDSPQPWQQEFEHLKIDDAAAAAAGGGSGYASDDSMDSDYDEAEAETETISPWEAFNRKRSEKSKQAAQNFLQQVEKNQIAEFPWPPDPNDCGPYEFIRQYLKDVEFQENRPELAKKFLEQVKSSWGYDVDCCPPRWVPTSYFQQIDVETMMSKYPDYNESLNSAADSVISEINTVAEAKKMGKRFELVRIIKAVFLSGGMKSALLLTLTIKDVVLGIEKTVRAMVSTPPAKEPKLVECKLIS